MSWSDRVPILMSGLLLSSCVQTAVIPMQPEPHLKADNPFFAASTLPYQLPPFDRIRDEHYAPAFEAGMAAQRAEIAAIAHAQQPPDFANTIEALERSGALLGRVSAVFFNLAAAHTNPQIQSLQKQLAPQLSAHRDAIHLDEALYGRVHELYQRRASLELEPEALRLLERYHSDFVRAGARLDDTQKERLRRLNEELSTLTTQFEQNLLADTNASAVVVVRPDQLEGLPPDVREAASAAATERGLVRRWALELQLPSGQPALASLRDRALREQLFHASVSRGANDNEHDNRQIAAAIATARAQRAALLGYASHAAYQLEDQTARTPQAVVQLLEQLTPPAVANARREAAELQALATEEARREGRRPFTLEPWDWAYYSEQLRKTRYDYDEQALKPYLALDRVLRDGVFFFAERLYGLKFVLRSDLPGYHPDVRIYEVFDADGSQLGLFIADFHARASKRGGAWMSSFVDQSRLLQRRPVVSVTLNVPKPATGQPALLTMEEVTTLFHEFGHALHGLLSDVRYPLFSGTSVPRDFVEYPSQVHEMWALDPTVLANYARHHETGEPMPQELIGKLQASEQFNQGHATTEYLAAAWLDMAWHQLSAGEPQPDARLFEPRALRRAGVDLPLVPPRYGSAYFAHIFAGGYAAGYYAYIWSEVLDADTVQWFQDNGGLRRENGDHFRRSLLSRGDSEDAMTLYRGFRGRDPQIAPLLERRGLQTQGAATTTRARR